jgi:GxxExxY protein
MNSIFDEKKYPLQKESYEIIEICMEVHRILGRGFLEIVYKDALEYEFDVRGIPYEREKNMKYLIRRLFFLTNFRLILWFLMISFLK